MRTTVDIPDSLYRRLKSKAAGEGRSVKELILRSVETELQGTARRGGRFVSLPLIPSRNPGSVVLDNAKIFEIIPFP
ncbi:MAG: ribbon-helix-helix protein, CopG family [Terriglobales bacterium]